MNHRLPGNVLVVLAWAGMALPPSAATEPDVQRSELRAVRRAEVHDLVLDTSGGLHGQVLDGQAQPRRRVPVWLGRAGRAVRQAVTDGDGRFVFPRTDGGVYCLQVGHQVVCCRAWSRRSAPPNALPALLVVVDGHLVRGQQPLREHLTFDPLLMGTVVTAAIVVPIAILNSKDDRPAGS
jgi:hypothetical protein